MDIQRFARPVVGPDYITTKSRLLLVFPKEFISEKLTRSDISDVLIIPCCYNLWFSPVYMVRSQGTTLPLKHTESIVDSSRLDRDSACVASGALKIGQGNFVGCVHTSLFLFACVFVEYLNYNLCRCLATVKMRLVRIAVNKCALHL
jgi:hypothetical protein